MKSNIKLFRLTCAIMALLCLAGCGNADSSPKETIAPEEQNTAKYIYTADTLLSVESSKDDALAVSPAIITAEGYYAIGGRKSDQSAPEGAAEEYEGQFDTMDPLISFVSMDGTVKELEKYELIPSETENEGRRDFRVSRNIEALLLRSDGKLESVESIFVSYSEAPGDVAYGTEEYFNQLITEQNWYIRVLDTDGTEISCSRLDADDDLSFYGALLDKDNNIISLSGQSLTGFSENGEILFSTQVNGYIYSITRLKDGRIAGLFYPMNGSSMNLVEIDTKTGEICEKIADIGLDAYELLSGGGEYDFYLFGGSFLYGYSLEKKASEKLIDWAECDLVSSRLTKMQAENDGSLKAFSMSYDEGKGIQTAELINITRKPYDPAGEKMHLTLASIYADDVLRDNVIDFNRAHKNVRIDLKDYSEYNTDDDYTAGYTKLMTEIAAGDIPDIIDVGADMPYKRLASAGIFEDLYPYLEADGDLSRSDFFENILQALEVDGKMYMACSGVGIYTAVGAASVVGDTPGWTYDDYYEALSKMPEGCEGYGVGMTKDTLLSISLALDSTDYMDWSTGKCSFDSPEFVKLLEYCNSFSQSFDYDNYEISAEDSETARIAEGRQMLSMCVLTSTKYMLNDYDKLFGGQSTFIGFPTSEGIGNMFMLANSLAMSSKCSDKQAAWEFIRTYLTEDFQEKIYYIPTNRNVFEAQIKDATTAKYETDANGNFKLDANGERIPKSIGTYYDGLTEVPVYYLSEHQADQLRDTILSASKLLSFDQSIEDIVTEGAQAFFEGQKSAEECAKLIQSKANIYINEQR